MPTLDVVVESPRTMLDAYGIPHPVSGLMVAFRGGILETADEKIIQHIRGLELWRTGDIRESEDAVPIAAEAVKVTAGARGVGKRAPAIETPPPETKTIKTKSVKVPKRHKRK